MSKSSGNVLTPDEVMAVTGPDPFRYYLLAENQFSQDGNFSWESLVLKNNADLANDWGNLVNRSLSMTRKYFPEGNLRAPSSPTHSVEISESFRKLVGELEKTIGEVDPSAYASACSARSRLLNLYIDRTKPWKLAKELANGGSEKIRAELAEVLYTLLEGIRWLATAWMPILPFGMPEVFKQLGITPPGEQGALRNLQWGTVTYTPGEPKPIYPRLEVPASEGE
jgi:methionyl-tRNA synthetase